MDLNVVAVVGRLGKDAELKFVGQKNTPLATFSVAVNDGWGDQKKTYWFDVDVWGKTAESLTQYLTKGVQVAVRGKLRQETWETDGGKRSKIKIVSDSIQLLGSGPNGKSNAPRTTAPCAPVTISADDGFEDDIPF